MHQIPIGDILVTSNMDDKTNKNRICLNGTMEVGGISHTGAATEVITFEVDTIDSGSALTVTVDLLGYLS